MCYKVLPVAGSLDIYFDVYKHEVEIITEVLFLSGWS